jgi:hypothetical protein
MGHRGEAKARLESVRGKTKEHHDDIERQELLK